MREAVKRPTCWHDDIEAIAEELRQAFRVTTTYNLELVFNGLDAIPKPFDKSNA